MKREKRFLVTWEIDIWETTSKRAAEKALEMQRDSESSAVVFSVRRELGGGRWARPVIIDLDESGQ